jgi:hypothetical protein
MVDFGTNDAADAGLQKTLLLHSIHRQAFFYAADDQLLVAKLELLFPQDQRTDKSRLLALLHEQFLVEEQHHL